ncbi:MAG: HEPN domain-containing protein [Candidatus Caldarchaeum sp.]|uniref:HEPN domain-containing protein n=2 Tax=Caldiarchaeum subterraneum TaxID=311458 RepID=A0A7J3WDQ5_CALS0|nr:HEPN domain-containing protein [Candidatus Caldarchaeales archaeon]MDJ0272071.1 HEPN domain-containing protein [Candidatus Caldarchaeales archaeon]
MWSFSRWLRKRWQTRRLACFMLEQAAQLYLKSALLKLVGEYGRTHSLRRLVWELAEASKDDELRRFGEERRAVLSSLEDAYIMSRYFPKEYSEMDAVLSVSCLLWSAGLRVSRHD